MIPFQKIFTMLIRTFSRPMLGYIKKKQQEKQGSKFAGFFIGLGRKSYSLQYWINIRILKTIHKKQQAQLKDQVLLEKGIQTFYQILFYIIVLGLPFWQLYKSSVAAVKKQQILQSRLSNLQKKLTYINQKINKIIEYSKQKNKQNRLKLTKQKSQQKLKHKNNQIEQKLNIIGEISSNRQEQSAAQKIQQLFQNAIQVVADEFEDVLDEMEFPSGEMQAQIMDQTSVDQDMQNIDIDFSTQSQNIVQNNLDIQMQIPPQIIIQSNVQIDITQNVDIVE